MGKVTLENLYGSDPSIIPSIVFVVVFGPLAIHHIYLMARKKCIYWWPFMSGVVFEVLGFIFRTVSIKDKSNIGLYAMQSLFILLPPAMYAASIYMTLGRLLIYIKAESVSLVKIRWMTVTFVTGDVLSFLLQGNGGGLQASDTESTKDIGSAIVITGLAIQLVFFGAFVVTSAVADSRLRKMKYNPVTPGKYQWRTLLYVLYAASVLILIRSIFRVVEYAQGFEGYLMMHEVFMYVFDATLMFLVVVLFSVFHPTTILVPSENGLLSEEEEDGHQAEGQVEMMNLDNQKVADQKVADPERIV